MGKPQNIIHVSFPKKDINGALQMPIYSNAAFEANSAEDLELVFQGKKPAHVYSRISNPTVQYFEEKIRSNNNALSVTALASGMAAISSCIITLCKAGDNIVTSKHLFGNTYSLFENTLQPFGFKAKYTDLTDLNKVEHNIDENTKAIFLETITNPQLEVADIKALSEIAKKHHILLIADTTVTPPNIFNSKEFGVDIEVISSTKYFSGGGTSVGGVVVDNGTFNWNFISKFKDDNNKYGKFAFTAKLKKEITRNLGSCLSPYNAYLQSIGLETLSLRTDKACDNAIEMARYLQGNTKVINVNHPTLKSSPFYEISKKQFGKRGGGILSFELENKKECFAFMNKLKLIRRATNLGDNKTLILHPASTIFCEYTSELKKEMSIKENMMRLSLGIEETENLIEDIEQAFL